MTLGLYSVWSVDRDGSLEITVNGTTLFITTGRFSHIDISGAEPTVGDFTQALGAALATIGAGFTVSFDVATSHYVIARGGTPFTIAYSGNPASTRMFYILGGIAADTAASFTSLFIPRYAIRPALQCVSNWTGLVTGDDSERRESDSGASYAVGATTKPRRTQWEHTHEPKSAILTEEQGGIVWAWEDVWRHAGTYQEPLVMTYEHFTAMGGSWPVFTLIKPDFSMSTHSLMQPDWDGIWRIRIEAGNVRFVGIP